MLDCLPSPEEWSPGSQYLMFKEHLQALRHHLEQLEHAAQSSAQELVQQGPHLKEINQRCLDANDLLEALSKQPEYILAALSPEGIDA